MKATLRRLLLLFAGAIALSGAGLAQVSAELSKNSCSDCPQMVSIPAGSFMMGLTCPRFFGPRVA
jgi:formylglycine-generating enzyme required for sulfatase activity